MPCIVFPWNKNVHIFCPKEFTLELSVFPEGLEYHLLHICIVASTMGPNLIAAF